MKARNSGRLGRLISKFKESDFKRGDRLLVAIAHRSDIHYAATRAGVLISTIKTFEKVVRDDGVSVPVYEVEFQ